MIDYFKAFEENYIPIDVQKGIEAQQSEEMFQMFVDHYRTLQFEKDYNKIQEGLLTENYLCLKEVAHTIKGSLGYLCPIVVGDVSNQLQIFIKERIPDKDGKIKYPFTEEDKIKVYKDSLFILTEMTALLRYFFKNYPDFSDKYNYDTAKKIIDDCYKVYFKRFSVAVNDEQNTNTNSNNNNNNNNNYNSKNLEKQQSSQTDKLQKSQQVGSLANENSQVIKEASMRQATQDKEEQKKNTKILQQATAAPIKEENSTLIADPEEKKEEGVGSHDIKLEQQEKNQPCCNACNIF
ncbi:hypothetical protein ABPG74_019531 [Tetrahymena malaccensis]